MRGKRRNWLKLLAGLLLFIIALGLTAPLWGRAAFKPIARAAGITFDRVEEKADGLHFENFRAEKSAFTLTAQSLKAPTARELWTLYRGGSLVRVDANSPVLSATGWKLTLKERSNKNADKNDASDRSTDEMLDELKEGVARLHRILPSAQLANGKIVAAGKEYTVGNLRWAGSVLDADVHWAELISPAEFRAQLPLKGPFQFSFRILPIELSTRATLSETNGYWALAATNVYKGNRVRAQAVFAEDGLFPQHGTLAGRNLRLAGKLFGIEEYEQVSGSLAVTMTNSAYTVTLDAGLSKEAIVISDPLAAPADPTEPDVRVSLNASGARSGDSFQPARVSEGTIKLGGADLEIERGMITPQVGSGWLPVIDIVARGKAQEREVTLAANGPLNQAKVQLSSQPPVAPEELRKLLGKIPGGSKPAATGALQ
ncbi:MAG TPA: hypothetical protein VEH27_05730 [Methylomirabilota bacterium]|nr:hypothetical protein [Methylomirabilota bacterium]